MDENELYKFKLLASSKFLMVFIIFSEKHLKNDDDTWKSEEITKDDYYNKLLNIYKIINSINIKIFNDNLYMVHISKKLSDELDLFKNNPELYNIFKQYFNYINKTIIWTIYKFSKIFDNFFKIIIINNYV